MSDWLDAEGHADRAFEMFERGRWSEAEIELRKALSLNPGQAEWHFNLALTLEASGRDSEAMASFERTIELAPDEAEPLVAAAGLANRLDRTDDALRWVDAALKIDSGMESAYVQRMEALFRRGDHNEVETTYYLAQQMLEEQSPACLAVMADSLIEREQWDRAGWCLREALRLAPTMPRLRARLGLVLSESGQPHRALHMYLRDLRDDPGNVDTLLDFGELLIKNGRLPEAGEKFRRVLELEPANVDAHAQLGEIALLSQRYEQAHVEFELVLKLEPEYPAIRLLLSEALLRRGRLDEARELLREELQRDDSPKDDDEDQSKQSDATALNDAERKRFGLLLLDAGLAEEASLLYERLVEQDKTDAELLRQLALARFMAGDHDGGAAASRRVLRLDRSCVRSMHNLALAALEAGRLRTAAGWIRSGLHVDRHDEGLRRLRGRLVFAAIGTGPALLGRAIKQVFQRGK